MRFIGGLISKSLLYIIILVPLFREKQLKREQELKERREKKEREELEKKERREKREAEKRKKEEERKKKEEGRKKREEERKKKQDEKLRLEQEKEVQREEKLRKENQAKIKFRGYFGKIDKPAIKVVSIALGYRTVFDGHVFGGEGSIGVCFTCVCTLQDTVASESILTPFSVKDWMTLAKAPHPPLEDTAVFDQQTQLQDKDFTSDYIKQCKSHSEKRRKRRGNVQNKETESGRVVPENDDDDMIVVSAESNVSSKPAPPKLMFKLLQFAENYRPAYYGTWRKATSIKPRNPFHKDEVIP